MCGITGIIGINRSGFSETLRDMTESIRHRGPDTDGFFEDRNNGIYIGHRRLSIIDLSKKGRQPMFNEDKSIIMVCNGEIYNYLELRDQLKQTGHKFLSNSDSEVIVHAYEEWGEDCFIRFNGMFAIAIWDNRNRSLFLVRDTQGIKPVLFLKTSKAFFFSSEVKSFLKIDSTIWTPKIDEETFSELLAFQYVYHPEKSLLEGVNKLAPGCFLKFKDGKIITKKFWTLERKESFAVLPFNQAVEECEKKLLQSVKYRLQSDVPVGILLSGGLDSSLITAMAKKVGTLPVHTFTGGFKHRLDERSYAARVAEYVGSEHHEIFIDPREINDRIEEIIYYFDDIGSLDGGLFTIFLIAEKIKKLGLKVLLVGEGADEIFAGYSWYGLSLLPFKIMPQIVRSALFYYIISRLLPNSRNLRAFMDVYKKFKMMDETDICRQLSRFDITRQLPSHFLMKEDHATMAHGIEARVPYLDREVVEFAYSLPGHYKYNGNWFNFNAVNEKRILRKVAEHYLPAEITGRKKLGFSIPVPEMLKSNVNKVKDYLLAGGSLARGLYSKRELERMMNFKNRMYSPIEKHKEFMIWKLFIMEVWKSQYLK